MTTAQFARMLALQGALAIITIIMVGAVLEGYARFTNPLHSAPDDPGQLHIFRGIYPESAPEILSLTKNYEARWTTKEFNVIIRTNAAGLRIPTHSDMLTAEVLVMGDSFTFGYGVEGSDRYGVQIGKLSGKKTFIASYNNGWAPPHYLKYFLANQKLVPEHIVLGLYLGNDLYTDIRETEIIPGLEFDIRLPFRDVDETGMLVNAAQLADPMMEWLRRNSAFSRWLFNRLTQAGYQAWFKFRTGRGHEAIAPNSFNPLSLERGEGAPEARKSFSYLSMLEKACRARNPKCTFHVILIPQNFLVYDPPYPATSLKPADAKAIREGGRSILTYAMDVCAELKLDCINPVERLQNTPLGGADTYILGDGHWTALGHYIAAHALCDHVTWCRY